MWRKSFILLLFFVLPSGRVAKPVDDESVSTWSSDLQKLSTWVSYGKQAYFFYEPEMNMVRCVMNKLWNLTYNYLQKSNDEDAMMSYITASPEVENSGNETMEKFNVALNTGMDIKVVNTNSREGRSGMEKGRLASLLGVTGERFVKDYNCTVVAGRKVDESNENSEGDVEKAMLQVILDSEPIGPLIVKLLHYIVYIIQSIVYWVRKSVVLGCIIDYIYQRVAEWIYLDI